MMIMLQNGKKIELNPLDIPIQSLLGEKTSKIMYSDNLNSLTMVPLNIWIKEIAAVKMGGVWFYTFIDGF